METLRRQFGRRVQRLRIEGKITQEQLADTRPGAHPPRLCTPRSTGCSSIQAVHNCKAIRRSSRRHC